MLVLSRKYGESLRIGPDITITLVRIGPNSVRIGIDAPSELNIVRTELESHETNGNGAGEYDNVHL